MSRDEAGSIAPLIIGFLLVLGTLVGVVVDASAAYLRRQGLDNLADAAALSATDGLQGEAVYRNGLGAKVQIDPLAAHRYVEDYLASTGARAKYPGLRVQVVTADDVVRVRLRASMPLPLPVPGVGTPTISGAAASEVLVSD